MIVVKSISCEPDEANFRYSSTGEKARQDGFVYAYAQDSSVLDSHKKTRDVDIRIGNDWAAYRGQALTLYFDNQFKCSGVISLEPHKLYATYLLNKYLIKEEQILQLINQSALPKPSSEQLSIIKAALRGEDLKVQAFAGTGKTTTIKMIAAAIRLPSTYVVFNSAAKQSVEGEIANANVATAHGLAYQSIINGVHGYYEKFLNKQKTWYLSSIRAVFPRKSDSELGIIIRAVKRFTKSPDDFISQSHIHPLDVQAIAKKCTPISQQALVYLCSIANLIVTDKADEAASLLLDLKKNASGNTTTNKIHRYLYSRVSHAEILQLLKDIISNFKNYSDADTVSVDDFPNSTTYKKLLSAEDTNGPSVDDVMSSIVEGAQHLWNALASPENSCPINYDCYVKIWQLSKPRIPTPVIFIDESQDLDPVMLSVLLNQGSQKIWVGDKYQQIYAWRGAVNAMEQVEDVAEYYLTETYRFNSEIASFANKVLGKLGEVNFISSRVNKGSKSAEKTAFIARYNKSLIDKAIEMAEHGAIFYFKGFDSQKLFNHCRSIIDLYNHRKPFMDMYAVFNSIEELETYLEEEQDDNMRKALSFCINANYRREVIERRLRAIEHFNREDANLTLITAHQSKGLEWDEIILADDFEHAISKESEDLSEWNLLYVAITRAKQRISSIPELVSLILSPIESLKILKESVIKSERSI